MTNFDPEKYRAETAELSLSREQENELLSIVWSLMKTFVDLGFGVDSVQMLLPELRQNSSEFSGGEVKSEGCRTVKERKEVAEFKPL